MIFTKSESNKPRSNQHVILDCVTMNGVEEMYLAEHVAYNNLVHLDTNNIPLRCYKIDAIRCRSIIIKNPNSNLVHLHLNKLLSYTNVTKNYYTMDIAEYDALHTLACSNCQYWIEKKMCTGIYDRDNRYGSCKNYMIIENNPVEKKTNIVKRIFNYIKKIIFWR